MNQRGKPPWKNAFVIPDDHPDYDYDTMIAETHVPKEVTYADGKVEIMFNLEKQLSSYGNGTYQTRDGDMADDHVGVSFWFSFDTPMLCEK